VERRRFLRAVFPAEASLLWADGEIPAGLRDVAYGGAYLTCSERPPVGAEVEIRFRLSGMDPPPEIRFKARVVRHGADGIGVKLTGIDWRSLGHLRRLLYFNLGDADEAERELRELLGEATVDF